MAFWSTLDDRIGAFFTEDAPIPVLGRVGVLYEIATDQYSVEFYCEDRRQFSVALDLHEIRREVGSPVPQGFANTLRAFCERSFRSHCLLAPAIFEHSRACRRYRETVAQTDFEYMGHAADVLVSARDAHRHLVWDRSVSPRDRGYVVWNGVQYPDRRRIPIQMPVSTEVPTTAEMIAEEPRQTWRYETDAEVAARVWEIPPPQFASVWDLQLEPDVSRPLTATEVAMRQRSQADVFAEARIAQVEWLRHAVADATMLFTRVAPPDLQEQLSAQKEAHDRSIELLKSHLTEEQRAEYDSGGCFHVIGSKTGWRFRIEPRHQMNVFCVEKGKEFGLCFTSMEPLALGDVLLSQKIILETDEAEAWKVGNLFGASGGFAPYRMYRMQREFGGGGRLLY